MTPFDELRAIVERLRAPEGCPWDRAQTPRSLRPYLVEETYEVIDAIESGDPEELRKELGDLLFQVMLLSEMAHQAGHFSIDEVAAGIAEKMVRRHPHVFEEGHEEDDAGTVAAWEARKARERGAGGSVLDGVPTALPALIRAHRVGEKVSRVGFDWSSAGGARDKVTEELAELDEAMSTGDAERIRAEYGDVLLAMASLGRLLDIGPEEALREANARFEQRFRGVEGRVHGSGRLMAELSPEELEEHWEQVKRC
ncbi:MAG TPA: nucleoside triphosphate pyrophosphohydrolase [Myxococcota bacterium]|nr:nucleoside triphosphate pyrophosphohydrolase [Myxococcota bacterium]